MTGPYSQRPIPGPDHGACPDCGGWLRQGMKHDCASERELQAGKDRRLVEMFDKRPLPWNEKTAPDRVRPRECVGNARDALDRAYGHADRAAVPLLIEAIDWLRRALEQMAPEDSV